MSFRDRPMQQSGTLHKCMRDIVRMLILTCVFAMFVLVLNVVISTKTTNDMNTGLGEIRTLLVREGILGIS